jgi:ABC-type multidrug transport system fused ATPase/permease subunit
MSNYNDLYEETQDGKIYPSLNDESTEAIEEDELETATSSTPMMNIDTKRLYSELNVFNAHFSVKINKGCCGIGRGVRKTILNDVSVTIKSGRICAIMGPSGF